jgi:hypothetical protein
MQFFEIFGNTVFLSVCFLSPAKVWQKFNFYIIAEIKLNLAQIKLFCTEIVTVSDACKFHDDQLNDRMTIDNLLKYFLKICRVPAICKYDSILLV